MGTVGYLKPNGHYLWGRMTYLKGIKFVFVLDF